MDVSRRGLSPLGMNARFLASYTSGELEPRQSYTLSYIGYTSVPGLRMSVDYASPISSNSN